MAKTATCSYTTLAASEDELVEDEIVEQTDQAEVVLSSLVRHLTVKAEEGFLKMGFSWCKTR
jgi:hypothetical protein